MKIYTTADIGKMNKKTLEKAFSDLQTAHESLKKSTDLPTDVAELQNTINEQTELITELSLQLEKKNSASSAPGVVNVDGQDYRIAIGKFKHKGEDKTAEHLKEDEKLCRELIARKSGVLKAI